MKPLTSHTSKLNDSQAEALRVWLQNHGFEFRAVPYARYAADKEKTTVVFYESGKLVVQGKGTQDFIEFVLEPEILKEARLGYESVLNPELLLPRLGVDESGKGDFFGPLSVAGVYINANVVRARKDAGIRDYKNIASDRRIKDLAELICNTPGCVTTFVPMGKTAGALFVTPATAQLSEVTGVPKGPKPRLVHWVEPEVVVDVAFTMWTSDGVLFLNYEVRGGRRYGLVNARPCIPTGKAM